MPKLLSRKKHNINKLNKDEEYILKCMNKTDILSLYKELESVKNHIVDIEYSIVKPPEESEIKNKIVQIKKIKYSNGEIEDISKNVIKYLFFFRSGGNSRKESCGTSSNNTTKNLWFPTNPIQKTRINPLTYGPDKLRDNNGYYDKNDLDGKYRVSKLEDNILLENGYDTKLYSEYNIKKYGRFLTEKNALISQFLLIDKPILNTNTKTKTKIRRYSNSFLNNKKKSSKSKSNSKSIRTSIR
jgi:hypothetical protein